MQKNNKKSLIWLTTPLNLGTEKEKFLFSKTYNPVFAYIWQNNHAPHYHLGRKAGLFKAMKTLDHKLIQNKAKKYFETDIDSEVLKEAEDYIKKTKPERMITDTDKLKNHLQQILKFFDIKFTVQFLNTPGFNVRPAYSKNKVYIGADIVTDYVSIEGLVKHEMVHIVRFINGKHNNIRFKAGFLPTDEGLASYVQDFISPHGERSYYQHAAEYVASNIGTKGSLRDIYEYFRSIGFSKNLAWQRAARHKFGFVNTSKPGDFIKPAMYYYHEQKIKKISKDKLINLFTGKIALKDIEKYKYNGIDEEKLTKYFFQP